MTLGELLTLLRESILNDRTDRVSGSSDYLWTDQTLVTYINEAQRKFAVESFILRDGTTDEVTKLALRNGVAVYDLHESIISVMTARNATQQADLARVGHTLFSGYRQPTTDRWQDPASYNSYSPGPALAFSTDEALNDADSNSFGQVSLRVYPVPAAAQDGQFLRLRVVRKPLDDLRVDALSATPEIPRDHQIEMLDWAAYLALRIVDDDAGSPRRADEFRQSFEEHVKKAKNLAMRKMFAPTGWAFGRGGWSWGND